MWVTRRIETMLTPDPSLLGVFFLVCFCDLQVCVQPAFLDVYVHIHMYAHRLRRVEGGQGGDLRLQGKAPQRECSPGILWGSGLLVRLEGPSTQTRFFSLVWALQGGHCRDALRALQGYLRGWGPDLSLKFT